MYSPNYTEEVSLKKTDAQVPMAVALLLVVLLGLGIGFGYKALRPFMVPIDPAATQTK